MRVASEAALKRAAEIRRTGKSWYELTATKESRQASLDFFRGARSSVGGEVRPAK